MAKRDKLTKRQKRQVVKNRENVNPLNDTSNLGKSKTGLVIARFGDQVDVLDKDYGSIYRCFLRQHLGAPVPGDRVSFRLEKASQDDIQPSQEKEQLPSHDPSTTKGVVESVDDRFSLLQRPSPHKGLKPIVANVNMIFVVVAPLPDFSSILLDRYLIAIKNANIDCVIVVNKSDMTDEINKQQIDDVLIKYTNVGYPVVKISTISNSGKKEFINYAQNKSSILVGQSGVGKSSIINWLFPTENLSVQAVSTNSRLGQHTTTSSRIYKFEQSSESYLVDSPGIREFGLWNLNTEEISSGYVEFEDYLGTCKFRDCKHVNEPCCEIINAVKSGKIDESRWKNYVKIINNNQAP
ncbi:MAG: small ribosomal subunit biogenesis GTPase RsgA [Kangiellaceae bacterium]